MKRLRVAMIAPPWLPIPPIGYGGIENVLAVLVPELRKLDIDVELFTIGDSKIRATKKHWLYKTGQYSNIQRPYYDALPLLVAHISAVLNTIRKDGGFDLIHDHNPYIGPAMLAYADNSLPPVLHTLHGPPFTTPDQLAIGVPDNLAMWRQLARSDRVKYVNISQAARKGTPRHMLPHLLKPVHNGIEVDDFPFVTDKDDYFITLARFHPNKGQAIAIDACQKEGVRLRMAGVVGDMARPKQVMMELANPLSSYRNVADFRYFSDRVFPHLEDGLIEYVGDLADGPKLKFLSRARALLFPIQWEEPFGMAVIEALACGTPVIAMERGAMPEIISHGRNGFLAHTKREFREYIRRIGDIDPADCRASVEQKFSGEAMAREYLERYQTLLEMY